MKMLGSKCILDFFLSSNDNYYLVIKELARIVVTPTDLLQISERAMIMLEDIHIDDYMDSLLAQSISVNDVNSYVPYAYWQYYGDNNSGVIFASNSDQAIEKFKSETDIFLFYNSFGGGK